MKTKNKLILAAVILLLGLVFHLQNLTEYPTGHHSWTQTDHYALSLGFLENGFDFFHPQTFIYTQRKIGEESIPSSSIVTAVDFPIHQYVVSLLMKVFNDSSVIIPKIYILLYSFLGLYFLGHLVFLLSGRFEWSLLMVVFAATAPMFVYFQTAIMPTIPSWANAIIGLFFWIKHLSNQSKKHFFIGIAFLTLAALARTTLVIPIVALLCLEVIGIFREKKIPARFKILGFVVSFFIIGGYYAYNSFLRANYGSIFLSEIMPPDSFERAMQLLSEIYNSWALHYFSGFQYLLLAAIVVFVMVFALKRKVSLHHTHKQILVLTIIYFVGCMFFAVLMMEQFVHHDYYFLDTFFIPVLLLMAIALSIIPLPSKKYMSEIVIVATIGLSIPFALFARQTNQALQQDDWWNRTAATAQNFEGSKEFLDQIGVPANADILVLDAYAPNLPFVHMQRYGHPLINTKTEYLRNALDWDWDFAVIQNEFFFSDVYRNYPAITNHLEHVDSNGKISVFKRASERINQDLDVFLGIDRESALVHSSFLVDSIVSPEWSFSSGEIREGRLETREEFPVTFKMTAEPVINQNELQLLVQLAARSIEDHVAELVVSINRENEEPFYTSFSQYPQPDSSDVEMSALVTLPRFNNETDELLIYLWNPKGGSFEITHGRVTIYPQE